MNPNATTPLNDTAHGGTAHSTGALAGIDAHARALVNERPLLALCAAVGAGFVLARLASRI